MPDTLRLAGALLAPHSHRESDLLDGDVYARLAASETVTGLWGFPAAGISIGQEALSSPSAGVLAVGGDLDVSGVAAVGSLASIDASARQALRVSHQSGDISIYAHGAAVRAHLDVNTTIQGFGYGLSGEVDYTGAANGSYILGLLFTAAQHGSGTLNWLHGLRVEMHSYSGAGAIASSAGLEVYGWYEGPVPATFYGLHIYGINQTVNTVYGVRVEDFTGTMIRLLEIGPSTPYLRLVGGGDPGANLTNLYLKEASTLRRVQWKAGNSLGAGDKVMVLV